VLEPPGTSEEEVRKNVQLRDGVPLGTSVEE